MSVIVDIRLKKTNKIYHEGDLITGAVVLETPTELKHDGITLTMEGVVNLQLSSKNVGIFEAFYNTVKPQQVCHAVVEVCGAGRVPPGKTEMPFEIPLVPKQNKTLYETYHGVFINIHYTLRCDLRRGFLAKDITRISEFILEYKPSKCEQAVEKGVNFCIKPESLRGSHIAGSIPGFRISGRLNSTSCSIVQPLTGTLVVEESELAIKSVELQLVRVETCGCAEGYARDVTEIQNIQIGEGNVACGVEIPVYMVFPRLFTCPTLHTNNFNIGFEVNIVVVFENDHLVSENFPIHLTRA